MIITKLMGGLGNHMFIYAYARALSLKYDIPLIFYDCQLNENKHGNDSSLLKLNIPDNISVIGEKQFKNKYKTLKTYFFRILCRINKNIPYYFPNMSQYFFRHIQPVFNRFNMTILNDGYYPVKIHDIHKHFYNYGYFQSEKFFAEYQDVIKNELRVKEDVSDKNIDIYQYILLHNSVCVHIRRGDYVGSKISDICTPQYFEKAVDIMKSIVPNAKFVVFSDDIEWSKTNIKWPKEICFVDNANYAHEDMQLMYNCKHFIISNSSFSWWAQYLSDNTDKIVIAPSKWVVNGERNDIYMKGWKLI